MPIHADIEARLNERSAEVAASRLDREMRAAGRRAGAGAGDEFGEAFERRVEQSSLRAVEQFTRASEALDRRVGEAQSRLGSIDIDIDTGGLRSVTGVLNDVGSAAGTATSQFAEMGRTVGELGKAAGPIAIAALVPTLVSLAGTAAAASGAIGLLPAAIGGAATAFGTLQLATQGFDEAMKNMDDPEAFAEALGTLAPSAQQTALTIQQQLMPAINQLQQATQQSFFANVGPQLQETLNALLPTVQATTTGIASAMNQMFMGVTNQLMTPETQANLTAFSNNVVAAFNQLAPAVAPLTAAFTELTAAGSSFLPGIAQGAADAATAFASFISEASRTGELQQWIGTGLDMMRQLGPIALNVAEAFLGMAPIGEQVMPMIVDATQILADVLPTVFTVVSNISPFFTYWGPALELAASAAGLLNQALSPVLQTAEMISTAMAYIRGDEGKQGAVIPKPTSLPATTPGLPQLSAPTMPGALGGLGGAAGGLAGARGTWGSPAGNIFANPGASTDGGRTPSATANLPVVPYTGDPMSLLQGFEPTAALYGAAGSVVDAKNREAQAESDLNALLSNNTATAAQIQEARNDVVRAERETQESEMRLNDAKVTATNKYNEQVKTTATELGEIGASIDKDFGISKGLGGIAENVTKFVANLAAAPLLGQLEAIKQANPSQGGYGLMGILGAQGAFGPQYTGIDYAAQASAMGPAALQPGFVGTSGTPYAGVALGSDMDVTNQPGLDLLRSMGLKGTTYSSHTDDGAATDREVDVTDPVGGYGSGLMTQFAQFARQNPHLFEEFIYSDPTTGEKTGIRSGQLVGPGTSQPGYYAANWAGHQDHAHIEPAKGGGLGLGGPMSTATAPTTAAGQSLWDAVAQHESSGNWANADTGRNGHYGGLQFAPDTWNAFGGNEFAPMPHQATREEQIAVANRTAFTGYNGQSPQGLGAWEVITQGKVPGVDVNTPASAFMAGASAPAAPSQYIAGAAPMSAGVGSSNLPIPLPVTIVGGAGMGMPMPVGSPAAAPMDFGGGADVPAGSPASGVGLGPAPGPAPGPVPGGAPFVSSGLGVTGIGPGMAGPPAAGGPGSGVRIGGVEPSQGVGGGGIGVTPGGTIDTAIGMAATGLDMLAPGAGQAAQTVSKLASRAIQYGGEVVGIGVQGALDTFMPWGGSKLASNNWATRIIGGLAGAGAALPNMAGKSSKPTAEQVADPNTNRQQGVPQPAGPTINQTLHNHGATEDANGRDMAWHATQAAQGPGM